MIDRPKLPKLKAPFPWFGGKSRAAALIWSRLGDVNNYVEPCCGSLAVLLGRDTPPRVETVNDFDCFIANFWRAVTAAPELVAAHADWPINEADLHARHLWLVQQLGAGGFRKRMRTEPDYFDVKIAGWWVWGISQWIGGGWCAERPSGPWKQRPDIRPQLTRGALAVWQKRPEVTANKSRGIFSQTLQKRPMLSGVHQLTRQQIPRIDAMCDTGANNAPVNGLIPWFTELQARLRKVRVVCGDWRRVLTDTPLGLTSNVPPGFRTGIVLDAPYKHDVRDPEIYSEDSATISADVRDWAIEHGDNPRLRIALCGYDNEHKMPDSWECIAWKAAGGYGNRTGNRNSERERIWFSPHCLKPEVGQRELVGLEASA